MHEQQPRRTERGGDDRERQTHPQLTQERPSTQVNKKMTAPVVTGARAYPSSRLTCLRTGAILGPGGTKMKRVRWRVFASVLGFALAVAGGVTASSAAAKGKDGKGKAPAAESDGTPPSVANACGCYKKGNGCVCAKKGKCACPGECEPVGCEEKRAKEMEKEMAAAVKAAQDDEKKRSDEEKKKAAEEEKKRQADEAAEQEGTKPDEAAEAAAEKPAKPAKAARKTK
jgi:hypothetical protein